MGGGGGENNEIFYSWGKNLSCTEYYTPLQKSKYLINYHALSVSSIQLFLFFQCDVCNKEFSCRSTLTKHLKRVHKMNIAQKENSLKMEKF